MFNLEQAIADWRQKMLAAGIETPVPLEELELHLREEMERQVRTGVDEKEAFEKATQSIGEAQTLKAEFKKVPEKPRDKFFRIACSLLFAALAIRLLPDAANKLVSIDYGFTYREGSFSYANLLIGPVDHLIPVLFRLMEAVGWIACSWFFYRDYPKFVRYIRQKETN